MPIQAPQLAPINNINFASKKNINFGSALPVQASNMLERSPKQDLFFSSNQLPAQPEMPLNQQILGKLV